MKSLMLSVFATVAAFSAHSQAATLSAKSLQCGGIASIETRGQRTFLEVYQIGNSNCSTIEVKSLNIRSGLDQRGLRVELDTSSLGNQLVVVVNSSEAVILDIQKANADQSSSAQTGAGNMTEYEKQRLEIEKQREARERARQNAEAASDALEVGAEVGGAVVDGIGSTER